MSKRSRITGITGPVTIDKWQPNTWKFLGKRLKNGKFLYGRNEKVTYPEATDICSNMGLQMALPESSYENEQELIFIFFLIFSGVQSVPYRTNWKIFDQGNTWNGLQFILD